MIVAVVRTQQAYAYIKFKMQMAGNTCSPSVADAGSDKEFTLIAFFAPLQVVFSTSGIESQEMSGQHFTVFTTLAASQPIASFQTAHQHLHTVLAPVSASKGRRRQEAATGFLCGYIVFPDWRKVRVSVSIVCGMMDRLVNSWSICRNVLLLSM